MPAEPGATHGSRQHIVDIYRKELLKEAWRGKTFARSLMNCRLKSEPALTGITIDVGYFIVARK